MIVNYCNKVSEKGDLFSGKINPLKTRTGTPPAGRGWKGVGFQFGHGFVDLDQQVFPAIAILPVSYDGDVAHVGCYFSRVRIAIAQVETRAFRHRYDHARAHHPGKFLSASGGKAVLHPVEVSHGIDLQKLRQLCEDTIGCPTGRPGWFRITEARL